MAVLQTVFDFGIAQSLFTHLPFSALGACLERIAPFFAKDALMFATIFEAPAKFDEPAYHPGGIVSYPDANPYHYRLSEIEKLTEQLCWRCSYIGDWKHPRDQKMLKFQKR